MKTIKHPQNILKTLINKFTEDKYDPRFLGWCTSYGQEVLELKELIDSKPSDEKQLRQEYKILTGKNYRSTK